MLKYLNLLLISILCLGTACSDNNEPTAPAVKESLSVESKYQRVSVDRSASTVTIPLLTDLKAEDLKVEQTGTWFVATLKNGEEATVLEIKFRENTTGNSREGSITVKTASKLYSVSIEVVQLSGTLALDSDVQIKPLQAKVNQDNPGLPISNTIDGDHNTTYHSPWTGSGTTMPVKIEYYFNGKETIDYIVYVSGNGNGNFGKFTLYAATDEARVNYEKIGDYDFYEKGGSSMITIPNGVKATAIKFEVQSGLNGYASCAEMEFYSFGGNETLNTQLLTVFTDLSCSELRKDVTPEKIQGLNEYFGHVAQMLYDGTYDEFEKDFRIRDYQAYSNNAEWSKKMMVRIYSDLDNPTGMYVEPGDEVVVCVGNTHGNSVKLQCIGDIKQTHERGDYYQTATSGPTYLLKEGINKFTMESEGQLFVMYNVPDITAASAKPIRIHFAPGSKAKVTGYFDLAQHKTDAKYVEIMEKAKHKKIAIKGENVIMYFNRSKINGQKIVGAIELWDNLARWEHEFCGINLYRDRFNNHIMSMSPEADNGQLFFWASDYQTAFIYTALKDNVIDTEEALSRPGRMWGVSHEYGHVHQNCINWEPSTETTANVYAHYVCERMGKYTSHGCGLHNLADLRAETSGDWAYIVQADGKYQNIKDRMNWQLYVYFSKVLGDKDFYVRVHEELREMQLDSYRDCSKKQFEFAKVCSKVANVDLTDFFELWGFFIPVSNRETGRVTVNITQPMIDSAKKYMAQFPKPKHALEYIEDRKAVGYLDGDFNRADIGDLGFFEVYKNNAKVSSNVKATVSGRKVTVTNAENAVAIEIRKGSATGDLVYFSNYVTFDIPSAVKSTVGCKIYAVQADGERLHLADI